MKVKHNISISDVVNSCNRRTLNKSVFGIEGYKIPDTSLIFYKVKGPKIVNFKSNHFLDEVTK